MSPLGRTVAVSIAALMPLLAGGCLESSTVTCASGRICAPGMVCDEARDRCVLPSQYEACIAHDEGEVCTFAQTQGVCRDAICVPSGCGDGFVVTPEECDGTNLNEMTCTDLGFYETPGLTCSDECKLDTSSCRGYCGDLIHNGGELCDGSPPLGHCNDYGFDEGSLGCTSFCGPGLQDCRRLRVAAVPAGATTTLFDVWGATTGELFAVGASIDSEATVVSFDGNAWSTQDVPGASGLRAVWGSAADDVWAVGYWGTVLHFDGATWTQVDVGTNATLHSVWGSAADDVIVAGDGGTVLRFDGATWTPMSLGTDADVHGVWGQSPNDYYAVGAQGMIRHWDGSVWSPMTSGTTTTLVSVRGAAGAVFAGGHATVLRSDGSTWTQILDGEFGSQQIAGLWVNGPDDVFAAFGPLLHWDGAGWVKVDSSSATLDILGLWGDDNRTLYGCGHTTVARYDGAAWVETASTNTSGIPMSINDLWAAAPDNIYAVGDSGAIAHFDGAEWSIDSQAVVDLYDLWGTDPDNVYAVGATGTILRGNAQGWTSVASGTSDNLIAVWASSGSDIWVATDTAALRRFDGSQWDVVAAPSPGAKVLAIWGRAVNDVWIAAEGGIVGHWNGTSWTTERFDSAFGGAFALWGTAAGDVFVGGSGAVHRWDGSQWSTTRTNAYVNISSIHGTGPQDLFIVGDRTIEYFDGAWHPIAHYEPTGERLRAVWVTPTSVHLGGDGGAQLRLLRTDW